jgi:hypothetical protein
MFSKQRIRISTVIMTLLHFLHWSIRRHGKFQWSLNIKTYNHIQMPNVHQVQEDERQSDLWASSAAD